MKVCRLVCVVQVCRCGYVKLCVFLAAIYDAWCNFSITAVQSVQKVYVEKGS